jgi:hypothetical protein
VGELAHADGKLRKSLPLLPGASSEWLMGVCDDAEHLFPHSGSTGRCAGDQYLGGCFGNASGKSGMEVTCRTVLGCEVFPLTLAAHCGDVSHSPTSDVPVRSVWNSPLTAQKACQPQVFRWTSSTLLEEEYSNRRGSNSESMSALLSRSSNVGHMDSGVSF